MKKGGVKIVIEDRDGWYEYGVINNGEIIEYINKEENNVENVGPSEIKILIEGVRAVMDLVIAIKNK